MNHAKRLRRALLLSALSVPFIVFAVLYMAFAIPGDGVQTTTESLVAFISLTTGAALFAVGWLAWLFSMVRTAVKAMVGGARALVRKLLRKLQLIRRSSAHEREGQPSWRKP